MARKREIEWLNTLGHPLALELATHVTALQSREEPSPPSAPPDYLACVTRVVDGLSARQADSGALIDEVYGIEWHYSTPCFALGAAALVAAGHERYRESAERALVWSAEALCEKRTPQDHPDFFTVPLVLADRLLCGHGRETQAASRWRNALRRVNPHDCYAWTSVKRIPHIHNWNLINSVGEFLRLQAGLGGDERYFEHEFEFHHRRFDEMGFYHDGEGRDQTFAYDAVSRSQLALLMAHGYAGRHADRFRARLMRGVLSSLFVQSPTGEWPGLGRSAHHQWNEAALAVSYEWAARELEATAPLLAGACRRGARLALESVGRWHRAQGDLFILRNRFEPAERHGFEVYSVHTTYNCWTVAHLVSAWMLTNATVAERPLPSEIGSYVIRLDENLHQVIASDAGQQLQIDTFGSPRQNATGLVRFYRSGCNSQLGPSEGAVSSPAYDVRGTVGALSYAPGWQDVTGAWNSLSEMTTWPGLAQHGYFIRPGLEVDPPTAAGGVGFALTWRGPLRGCSQIRACYRLADGTTHVRYELTGRLRGVRAEFPILEFDGAEQSTIAHTERQIVIAFRGSTLAVDLQSDARIVLTQERMSTRTGVLRRAYAETPLNSIAFRLRLEPAADAATRQP